MSREFEFDQQLQAQNSIEIENIGDFGLEAINEEGFYYYLAVKTLLGTTIIGSCGPIIPDIDMLPSGFNCSINKMTYKEDKLFKTINLWLNDKSKKIKNAKEIRFEEAVLEFKDAADYLHNLNEENF